MIVSLLDKEYQKIVIYLSSIFLPLKAYINRHQRVNRTNCNIADEQLFAYY